jgi:predicted RecB family nuclease
MPITASILYNVVHCPQRVALDAFGDPAERDTHPSGAASVEWFDRWCRDHDPAVKQRILDYNEDDCRATRVLLDGIRELTAL